MDIKTTKKKNKKSITIIAIIAVIVLIFAFGSVKPNNITAFDLETDLSEALQVPNSKNVVISYEPTDADNANSIACYVTDTKIADLKLKSSDNGKITYELIPKAKGKTTIKCTADDYETDFEFSVSTSELEAKEAAEKAEAERIAAEKKAEEERLAAEKAEQERIAAEQKAEQERLAAEQAAKEQAAAQQQEQTVYVTPSGKRYHLSSTCGGKNSRPVSISQVGNRTPCQKCA